MGRAIKDYEYEAHAGAKTLIVFVHGWMRRPKDWAQARAVAREGAKTADHLVPDMDIGFFSMRRVADVAQELFELVDKVVAEHGGYKEIVLVGHSCGAVMARDIWVRAHGARTDGSLGVARPWAGKIRRLVLMAAINRGFNTDAPASLKIHLLYGLADAFEFATGPKLMAFDLRRGSPYLTTLRLNWMAVPMLPAVKAKPPVVVQVLGTVDDIVAPGDNIDLATGSNFFYLEAPNAGHQDILDFAAAERRHRRDPFCTALFDPPRALKEKSLSAQEVMDLHFDARDDLDIDEPDAPPAEVTLTVFPKVQQVVFVIHGIRDYGYWTKKLAARIKKKARESGGLCRSVTSTYGFFPMGPFLLPMARRRRVEWLLDQYVTAKTLYPNATFQFIGHSNGTYLLADALRICQAVRFERAVLAGSVVRSGFDWSAYMGRSQLKRLVNYVATDDIVVASVPRFVQWLRCFDIGSGGHDGFRVRDHAWNSQPKPYTEVRYVIGKHSAALAERHWDQIADFLVNDADVPDRGEGAAQTFVARNLAWLGAPLAAVLIVSPFLVLFSLMGAHLFPGVRPLTAIAWLWALLLLAWLWVVGQVLTKL
jgi:hypothetical protein